MKYIINTGCSYGVMFRSFKEFTKGNDSEFQIIDLHCDSTGAEYQKRSVIDTISKLFKNGVHSKNIYVITEWSQPNRLFVELPKEFCNEILLDIRHAEETFIIDNKFKRISGENDYVKKYKSLTTIFGDRVYANIEHSDLDSFENKNIKFYINEFIKNTPISNKPIDRIEQYLTNILDLQSFLKSNNIQYSFFLMNNTFEGYHDNFLHVYGTKDIKKYTQMDVVEIPNLTELCNIYDFSEYSKSVWNLLDLSNFCFYKTDKFNYGGIDEYTMEKFGHIAYTSSANSWDIPQNGYITSFGAHPHDSIYVDFFKEYIYNKIKPFIGKLEFDMSNRWDSCKHNSIRKWE